jgi:uncharacterized membrane protein YoaK (UPF0700 family)
MKLTLPVLLSFNGGYVDAAGYLALQGLFTSHVTGNFVTIGAALVLGTSGVAAKLLAVPVFCTVILAARLASFHWRRRNWQLLKAMLTLQLIVLVAGAILAIWLGPFVDGDASSALWTGMTLVSAMAIQNAAHRIHLGEWPPTTVMTSTTTQLMIDVADLVHGMPAASRHATVSRVRHSAVAIGTFALGAAAAALLASRVGNWCFVVPPLVILLARMMTAD